MGGAFEVILVPCMIVMWYILVLCFVGGKAMHGKRQLKLEKVTSGSIGSDGLQVDGATINTENSESCHCDCDCDIRDCCKKSLQYLCCQECPVVCFDNILGRCLSGWLLVFGGIFSFCMVGITFQLGVLGFTGKWLYIIRMFENVIIMTVITVFAFDNGFDCGYCADSHQRYAFNNSRIFGCVIIGWASILIHTVTSFSVAKMIDKDWNLNFDKMDFHDLIPF